MDQDQQKLVEAARQRVSTMLTLAYATGAAISQAEIRSAALVKLSRVGVQSASLAANAVLLAIEQMAVTLAGLADDAALEALLAGLQPCLTPDEVAGAWLFGDLIAPTPDPEGNGP